MRVREKMGYETGFSQDMTIVHKGRDEARRVNGEILGRAGDIDVDKNRLKFKTYWHESRLLCPFPHVMAASVAVNP
jgi:hypothetical protein